MRISEFSIRDWVDKKAFQSHSWVSRRQGLALLNLGPSEE